MFLSHKALRFFTNPIQKYESNERIARAPATLQG
jgi:hypothetical protein